MKIKLFEYVAAGHDLSHWNSDMRKKLCICDGFFMLPKIQNLY